MFHTQVDTEGHVTIMIALNTYCAAHQYGDTGGVLRDMIPLAIFNPF